MLRGYRPGGQLRADRRRTAIAGSIATALTCVLAAAVWAGQAAQIELVKGTKKADTLTGTAGKDRILGFAGDDWLRGLAGDDVLDGGRGRDTISGGPGNDRVLARDGARDRLYCGFGTDTAVADALDRAHNDCETVLRPSKPPVPPESRTDCATTNYTSWNWEECKPGTKITVTNKSWECRRPLSSYGALPIKVVSRWEAGSHADIAVSLNNDCAGSPGNDVNLIVAIQNEGGTVTDVFKTRGVPGPQHIRMTGYLQGGARRFDTDHQDCIQLQGGDFNYLVNVECPGYDSGKAAVQGAGGALFFSLNQSQMTVLGGKFIGCNHSLNAHAGEVAPGSSIINAKFRSGNDSTPFCSQFFTSRPCIGQGLADFERFENVTCQRWVNGRWVDVPAG